MITLPPISRIAGTLTFHPSQGNQSVSPLVFSGTQRITRKILQEYPRTHGVAVYCSFRGQPGEPLYELAYQVGKVIGSTQKEGKPFFVVTGGGDGLMTAVSKGAIDAGSKAIGVDLTFEDAMPSAFRYSLTTRHQNFPSRIYGNGGFEHFSAYSVVLPGGAGTLHELITKANELFNNHTIFPSQKQIILVDYQNFFTAKGGFIDHLQYLINQKMVKPEFLEIFKLVKDPQEIPALLLDSTVPWTNPKSPGNGVRLRKLAVYT